MIAFRHTTGRLLTILTGFYGLLYFKLLENYSFDGRRADDSATPPIAPRATDARQTVTRNQSLLGLLERSPSVDYFSCCGVGHRFSKLSDSYYLAQQIGFGLRVFFGFCDEQEVFSYFFGSQPVEDVVRLTSRWNGTKDNLHLKVNNENPGFTKLVRTGDNATCRCTEDRLQSDMEFYSGIRNQFREKERVELFRKEHFVGKTVIGMHIRAGNGESGDFERKNRTISDIDQWSDSMSRLLIDLARNFTDPPLLFIATDTAHVLSNFKTRLQDSMPVMELFQDRVNHGQGVLFGERGKVENEGEKCLKGWSDSFTDMMILSHADVVVAGRPSSFTQSLPMTMALSKPEHERKILESYCEVNPSATEMKCYHDLMEWCCQGVTEFSLQGIQRYDYRRMPRIPGLNPNDYGHHVHDRPSGSTTCIPKPSYGRDCLPYIMPNADTLKEITREEKRVARMKKWKESLQLK
jgi:Nodulation protein Z (NodZ)